MKVKKKYFWQSVLTGLLLFLLISMVPSQVFSTPPGSAGPAPMVTVTRIKPRDITPETDYVGHVEAIQTVDLRARVEGVLVKVNFREGDMVTQEDVLFRIEAAPYQARVDADRARLQQADAELIRAGQHLK
ncbi:MAG: biotin/lipoyl-binding protein, partial [Proteobacteria bacterium]|nr:biotin/lipoyl-binding protein [Pseudomonadota bacterium]